MTYISCNLCKFFIVYNVAQSLYFCIISTPVANLLHGGRMMLFCSVQTVTIALLLVFPCCSTPFSPLQTTFYFVLFSSTLLYNLLALSFTPCYPVLHRSTLCELHFYFMLFYFVLLRSTLFYSVLLRFTPRTLFSATPFYHSLTTFFTSFLAPCWSVFSLWFTVIQYLFCIYSVSILHLFFPLHLSPSLRFLAFFMQNKPSWIRFLCRIMSLTELAIVYIWLPFLDSWTVSTASFPSFFSIHPSISSCSFSLFSPLYVPFFRLFRYCGKPDFCPLSQLCKLTNSP